MKRMIRLLAITGIAIGAIWFERIRRRGDLPGLITHRFNPIVMRLGLAGGRRSPWAIVEHVGRRSGVVHRTPMSMIASARADHVYVRLSYGADVDWVRNVKAAGHCRVQSHETIYELDEPAVVAASENLLIPSALRAALDRAGRTYLRLHILERVPGTFIRPPAEPAQEPAAFAAPALEVLHPAAEAEPVPA